METFIRGVTAIATLMLFIAISIGVIRTFTGLALLATLVRRQVPALGTSLLIDLALQGTRR